MASQVLLHIVVPKAGDTGQPPEAVFEVLLVNLCKEIRGRVSLECVGYGQYVYLILGVDEEHSQTVQSLVYASFPEAEIEIIEDYASRIDPGSMPIAAATVTLRRSDAYPIQTYDERLQADAEALSTGTGNASAPSGEAKKNMHQLFSAASTIDPDAQMWIQIVAEIVRNGMWFHFKQRMRNVLGRMLHVFVLRDYVRSRGQGEIQKFREEQAQKKGDMVPMRATIRCACVARTKKDADRLLRTLLASLHQFDHVDLNGFSPRKAKDIRAFLERYRARASGPSFAFTPKELATIYHFPDPAEVPNVIHVLSRRVAPPQDLPRASEPGVVSLGIANYHNSSLPFGIRQEDRQRNCYVVGESGSGREILLQRMILSDIERGRGVAVLDPHGMIVDGILPFIPPERVGDVLLMDPSDTQYPIAFNPLEGIPETLRVQFVDAVIGMVRKMLGSNWSPDTEHLLRYTLGALLNIQGATLLTQISLYKDPEQRGLLAGQIRDALIRQFWTVEYEQWSQFRDAPGAVNLIMHTLGQLLSSAALQPILGQPRSSFNLREMMRERKILLWKVPKGYLGEQAAVLLGSLFAIRLGLESFEQSFHGERRDFHFYMDEFYSFQTEGLVQMMQAAQQYPLHYVLSHQNLGQLDDDTRKLILANVGAMVCLRVGKDDAEIMAKELAHSCTVEDLLNLNAGEFFVKMTVSGKHRPPFTGRILPLPTEARVRPQDVLNASRRQFSAAAGQDPAGQPSSTAPSPSPPWNPPMPDTRSRPA